MASYLNLRKMILRRRNTMLDLIRRGKIKSTPFVHTLITIQVGCLQSFFLLILREHVKKTCLIIAEASSKREGTTPYRLKNARFCLEMKIAKIFCEVLQGHL